MNGSKIMKPLPVSTGLLLLLAPAVTLSTAEQVQVDAGPSIELLEFIGEWALENGQWQDPHELQTLPAPDDGKKSDEKHNS